MHEYTCEGCEEVWEVWEDIYKCNDCSAAICDSCVHNFWTTCCDNCGEKLDKNKKEQKLSKEYTTIKIETIDYQVLKDAKKFKGVPIARQITDLLKNEYPEIYKDK